MLFNNYLGVCFYNIFDTCLIYLTGGYIVECSVKSHTQWVTTLHINYLKCQCFQVVIFPNIFLFFF